jgi:hypothetical protein
MASIVNLWTLPVGRVGAGRIVPHAEADPGSAEFLRLGMALERNTRDVESPPLTRVRLPYKVFVAAKPYLQGLPLKGWFEQPLAQAHPEFSRLRLQSRNQSTSKGSVSSAT